MALVTIYLSTAPAGTGDGTSWANRALGASSGVISSLIRTFDFTSNSLLALFGPGTYTVTTALAFSGTTTPTPGHFPCFLHGCDSSGNMLTPPSPSWTADSPAWDDSALPVMTTTGTNSINANTAVDARLMKFTSSGATNGSLFSGGTIDWCSGNLSASSNSNATVFFAGHATNNLLKISGSAYAGLVNLSTAAGRAFNNQIIGSTAATSGNRCGILISAVNAQQEVANNCITSNAGDGIYNSQSNSTGSYLEIIKNVIVGNLGNGVNLANTSQQTGPWLVQQNYISGNGGYGISCAFDGVKLIRNRLRNNTSGSTAGTAILLDNITNAGTDADEFVNATGGDYRNRYGGATWGKGFGVSDQSVSAPDETYANGQRVA